jgi:hypothetical protein
MDRAGTHDAERPMGATYVAVMIVEVVVLFGLWYFGRYFGAP